MRPGIVLVHGYTGSPEDLSPVAGALTARFGRDSVWSVLLPGHGHDTTPVFDLEAFTASVSAAVGRFKQQGRRIILFGHSTGGSIILSALQGSDIEPALLILASVPRSIDRGAFSRWSEHREGKAEIPFSSIAGMVSCINATGNMKFDSGCPVLVLHGGDDRLVPPAQAGSWDEGVFRGPVRRIVFPCTGHHLFAETDARLPVDAVVRAVEDCMRETTDEERGLIQKIVAAEPEAERFLVRTPASARHLANSPSGRTAAGLLPQLPEVVSWEPTLANIEITTRCNLRCVYCARATMTVPGEDMTVETFGSILGLLPHTYRITLVGLGETLLHPRVVDLVKLASSVGRRTALVTNAMLLDEAMARALLDAGLESIAFSIDGATPETASAVRPGTNLERITGNIRKFVEISRSSREISTAVFSAVSVRTVAELPALIDLVAGLGVHVLMLTDLNFSGNTGDSLWKNADPETAATIRKALAGAFKKNLPVLSVTGLEAFGLWERYTRFLLLPPERLYSRSARHAWCFSPWQTVPVSVRGDVTLCDCRPDARAGNILTRPLSEIWNGPVFTEHRRHMLGEKVPEACSICPRF